MNGINTLRGDKCHIGVMGYEWSSLLIENDSQLFQKQLFARYESTAA